MKFRPEADIWPVMSDAELRALAVDIESGGQQYPISLLGGDILDGRNRWLAIKHYTKLKPVFENVDPDSPIAFVISRNEKRRHESESQRGISSARALPFYEAEAKARQAEGQKAGGKKAGRGRTATGPIGPQPIHRARDDAARDFGTTARTVQRGKSVLDKGSKKLIDAVQEGRLSLGKAEQITKTYPEKRKQDKQVAIIAESKMVTRVKGLTGEIEWYTPRKYLDAAVAVMGAIDLDPASSQAAQAHVKAKKYFTIEQDGLVQPWTGRVFLNPPYAMPFIKQFTTKMVESFVAGGMEGILLTNNATDTEWFHIVMNACTGLCLTRGRISFLEASDGELTEKPSPTHGQAFFYFGPHLERFANTFGEFGTIVCRYQQTTALMKVA
jgi:DNA N-6-adenine-methyltransferase (Dam)